MGLNVLEIVDDYEYKFIKGLFTELATGALSVESIDNERIFDGLGDSDEFVMSFIETRSQETTGLDIAGLNKASDGKIYSEKLKITIYGLLKEDEELRLYRKYVLTAKLLKSNFNLRINNIESADEVDTDDVFESIVKLNANLFRERSFAVQFKAEKIESSNTVKKFRVNLKRESSIDLSKLYEKEKILDVISKNKIEAKDITQKFSMLIQNIKIDLEKFLNLETGNKFKLSLIEKFPIKILLDDTEVFSAKGILRENDLEVEDL